MAYKVWGKWYIWPRSWKVGDFRDNGQQVICTRGIQKKERDRQTDRQTDREKERQRETDRERRANEG